MRPEKSVHRRIFVRPQPRQRRAEAHGPQDTVRFVIAPVDAINVVSSDKRYAEFVGAPFHHPRPLPAFCAIIHNLRIQPFPVRRARQEFQHGE